MPRIELRAARGVAIRATRRAARNLPPDPRSREQQLAELEQRLQVSCDHNNFVYSRPGHCEICEYDGWIYIYRCRTCGFTACNRCHNFHWDEADNPWRVSNFRRRHHDDEIDEETDEEPVGEDESN